MSQEIDEFLKALKDISNSEVSEIQNTADPKILAIKEKMSQKMAQLEAESHSFTQSQDMIDSFQREISKKQVEWLKQVNVAKGHLLDQLMKKLEDQFKSLTTGAESTDLLIKLFQEIKQDTGDHFEVHITKNCDAKNFKTVSGVIQSVIPDLDRVGVLVKRLDLPIDIENTLESRFAKNKEDLIITASQGLWNDLKESPWQTQQIMSQLLSKG